MEKKTLWVIMAKRIEDCNEIERSYFLHEIEYSYAPVTDKESGIKKAKAMKSFVVAWASSQYEAEKKAQAFTGISLN